MGRLGRKGAVSIDRQFDYGLTDSAITEQDLENYSVWIWDGVHMLSCPESKGWQWKHLDGHVYIAVIEPKPEEVPGREKMFRERMMPFVDDLAGGWARDIAEAMQLYKRIQEVDIAEVTDLELRELF